MANRQSIDGKPAGNIITVDAGGGGDFEVIQDAISHAINTYGASTANPYTILVSPGTYREALVLDQGIHVEGVGEGVVINDRWEAGLATVTMGSNSSLRNVDLISKIATDVLSPYSIGGAGLEDVVVDNVRTEAGAWAVYLLNCSMVKILNCRFIAPMAIHARACTGVDVKDCVSTWVDNAWVDVGFADIRFSSYCRIEANRCIIERTGGGVAPDIFAPVWMGQGADNIVNNNEFSVISESQIGASVIIDADDTAAAVGNPNIVRDNDFIVETQVAANPMCAEILGNYIDAHDSIMVDLVWVNNRSALRSTVAPFIGNDVFKIFLLDVPDDTDPSLGTAYVMPVPNWIIDSKQQVVATVPAVMGNLRNLNINWYYPPRTNKLPVVQTHVDVREEDDDAIWDVGAGVLPLDAAVGTCYLMTVGGVLGADYLAPDIYRSILLTANQVNAGVVRVHGWDHTGRYVTEDLDFGGAAAIESTIAFATLWYLEIVTSAVAATTCIVGYSDVVGLYHHLALEEDVIAVATGGAVTRGVLAAPGGGTVDVVAQAVDMAAIADANDLEFHYLTDEG